MDIPIVRWTDPENGEIHEDKVFCVKIIEKLLVSCGDTTVRIWSTVFVLKMGNSCTNSNYPTDAKLST